MTEQEVKQYLIDTYLNLLRIKACETGINSELNRQILATKIILSSYNLDLEQLEKTFDE